MNRSGSSSGGKQGAKAGTAGPQGGRPLAPRLNGLGMYSGRPRHHLNRAAPLSPPVLHLPEIKIFTIPGRSVVSTIIFSFVWSVWNRVRRKTSTSFEPRPTHHYPILHLTEIQCFIYHTIVIVDQLEAMYLLFSSNWNVWNRKYWGLRYSSTLPQSAPLKSFYCFCWSDRLLKIVS